MKILQLTDCHLFSTPTMTLHGHATYHRLAQTIDFIAANHNFECSAVLVTGDISQDGSLASYRHALRQIERLALPVFYIAGNHDDPHHLDFIFKGSPAVRQINELCFERWRFIAVNTTQAGKDSGWISTAELIRLEQQIIKYQDQQIALIMHHHPVPVGIPLVDDCRLLNGDEIVELCYTHTHIKSLVCGHAHTRFMEMRSQCLIAVGPATCFQWRHGAITIQTEAKSGFNLLEFGNGVKVSAMYI